MSIFEVVEDEESPPIDDGERICTRCGMPIDDKGTKYCSTCRSAPKGKASAKGKAKVTVVPPAAVQKKANGVVTKLLIIGTMLLASQRLNGIGIDDQNLENQLALTLEEASAIAAPITRVTSKTVIGSKIIQPLAENEDLLEAGVALFEYYRRTQKAINGLKAAMQQQNGVNGRVPASSTASSGQQRRGFPVVGNPSVVI